MHFMKVLDTTGDEKLEWNPEDPASIEVAKGRFEALKEKGYRFYEAVVSKGNEITEFDPSLKGIIAAPKAEGGPVATLPI